MRAVQGEPATGSQPVPKRLRSPLAWVEIVLGLAALGRVGVP